MNCVANQPAKKDLPERTLKFADDVRAIVRRIPRTISNSEDGKQLVRSSGSIGANYMEASEAMSKRDARRILKICRKEAKESCYWLKLIFTANNTELEKERSRLVSEAEQLLLIFSSIVSKLS